MSINFDSPAAFDAAYATIKAKSDSDGGRPLRVSLSPELPRTFPLRTFRNFRINEGSTDRATFSEFNLANDFKINIIFLTTGSSSHVLFGDNSSSSNLLAFIGNGTIRLVVGGVQVFEVDNQNLNDSFLHSAVLERVGSTITLSVDDILIGSGTSNNTFTISSLYAHNSGSAAFLGILADFQIYDDGVLVGDYPIDGNSDILANRATALGPNLNESSDPLNSVLIGGPSVTFYNFANLISGVDYIVSVSISNYSGSNSVGVGGGSGVPSGVNSRSDNGDLLFAFTADSTFKLQLFNRSSNQCTFSNLSVRQADGYGTIINGTADQWRFFQKQTQAAGDWFGREGLANGNFSNGLEGFSDPAGNWSVVNEEAVMGLTSSYTPLRTDLILEEGVTYRVPVAITAITGEMLLAVLNSDFSTDTSYTISTTGNKVYSVVGAGGPLEIRRNVEASVSLDNVSVKEVLYLPTIPVQIALFNSNGALQCNGTLSCSQTIPCGE